MRTLPSSESLPLHRRAAAPTLLALALVLAPLAACGGGGDDGPTGNGNGTLSLALATPSGNGQSAAPGAVLADPLRVLVRRDGAPAAGVTVAWSAANGGTMTPASSATGSDGIASSSWQLGPGTGTQGATATVAGASGSPRAFTATATTGGPGANVVQVSNNQFSPSSITVARNATVRWEWTAQAVQHTIVPIAPATIPSVPAPRDGPSTYEASFAAAGTYDYYCSVHGTPTSGMRGRVVVQ